MEDVDICILSPFGLFCGTLVYFKAIWYISSRFGMLYQEKSGNPAMYEYVCMSTIVGGHKGAIFPPMSDQISLLQNHGPHRTESCPQDSRQPRHHEEERSLKTFSVLSVICFNAQKAKAIHF
jgi:hypothetical protein